MKRVTVAFPEDLHRRIRALAAERGISMAALLREALEAKAAQSLQPRPRPRSLGIAASGSSDIASTIATERVPPRA